MDYFDFHRQHPETLSDYPKIDLSPDFDIPKSELIPHGIRGEEFDLRYAPEEVLLKFATNPSARVADILSQLGVGHVQLVKQVASIKREIFEAMGTKYIGHPTSYCSDHFVISVMQGMLDNGLTHIEISGRNFSHSEHYHQQKGGYDYYRNHGGVYTSGLVLFNPANQKWKPTQAEVA